MEDGKENITVTETAIDMNVKSDGFLKEMRSDHPANPHNGKEIDQITVLFLKIWMINM
jgi:hypothetical protein